MMMNVNDAIFRENDAAMKFLMENGIILQTSVCEKCGDISKLIAINEDSGCIAHRCKRKGCQARKSLFTSKIPLFKVLQIIYFLLIDVNYRQLYLFFGIADSTISRIKKNLLRVYNMYLNVKPRVVLGGIGQIVEVDESVISRRGIIRSPTSHDDAVLDTIWILGAVNRNEPQDFILKRIPDRTIPSILSVLEGHILVCSNLHSDGHPSYPAVARALNVNHLTVNHSRGFRAEDGTHTNGIEGFWAHMKNSMRKEHGVNRELIDDWITQYTFKRRYIMKCERNEFFGIFCEVLKFYFQLND